MSGSEPATTRLAPITAEWLRTMGFHWHEVERSGKHWLLWIGWAVQFEDRRSCVSFDDLGIELTHAGFPAAQDWHCWLRSDVAGRYHRFIHLRYLKTQDDLIRLIEGLTFQPWDPANVRYGNLMTPEQAERSRTESERLDRRLREETPFQWYEADKDPSRARALPEERK